MADIRQVGFVTRRYHDLQGLTLVAPGFALILAALLGQIVHDRAFDAPLLAIILLSAAGYASEQVRRAYRSTFGNVVAPRGRFSGSALSIVLFTGVVLDEAALRTGRPGQTVCAALVAAYAAAVLVRDWPWRKGYALLVGAACAAIAVTSRDPVGGASAAFGGYVLLGTAAVVVGALDHGLLVSTFDCLAPPSRGRRSGFWIGFMYVVFSLAAGVGVAATGGSKHRSAMTAMLLVCVIAIATMLLHQILRATVALATVGTGKEGSIAQLRPLEIRLPQTAQGTVPLVVVAVALAFDAMVLPFGIPLASAAIFVMRRAAKLTRRTSDVARWISVLLVGGTVAVLLEKNAQPVAQRLSWLLLAIASSLALEVFATAASKGQEPTGK